MIVLAILALGFVSVRNLAVDLFPKIDLPVAVVATSYGDAAPEEVEKLVSRPIENAISSVEGIEMIQSQSQADASVVIMMFKNGVDLDQTLLEVRERIDQVKDFLPDRANNPRIMRFSPEQLPVIWIGLTGKDAEELTELADAEVVPYMERQEGVASVTVEGSKVREIQLVLDEVAMERYGVQPGQIMQAINSTNTASSVGTIERGDQDLQVLVTGEFTSIADIENTVIQTPTGAQLVVSDVADVVDTYKKSDGITLVNGEPSVVLSIMKKTDANTVEVAQNVKGILDGLEAELPDGVGLDVIIDTSEFIELAVDSVISNILIGGAISIFILLLFLKSIRATIVIGLSIPIAIISTFALMYFTGESLNILTLGGLALGIGMMVDSSIVILENIYSYRQRGYSLFESATKGAAELTPAVIASTTTTLVVFLPIVFVDGLASDLFTPLALTVSFSLLASLVVAVTVVPMLSSKLLSKAMENDGKRYWFDRFLHWLNERYAGGLRVVMRFRKTAIVVTLLFIAASVALTPRIGAEFIPAGDQGQMSIRVDMKPGTRTDVVTDIVDEMNDVLADYNHLIDISYVTVGSEGAGGIGGSSGSANYTIQLIPSSERDVSTTELVSILDERFEVIAGANVVVSEMEAGMGMGSPIEIQLSGPEHDVLQELANVVEDEISGIDGVYNPDAGGGLGVPQLHVDIDKQLAAANGLTVEAIQQQIEMNFIGSVVSRYREDGKELDVTIVYPEGSRETIADLEDMKIHSESGAVLPLRDLATFEERQGPVTLTRQNQQAQINVVTDISGRDLNSVVKDIEVLLDGMNFPEGYRYAIGGEAEDMQEAFADLTVALIFSIFLVYAVMAIQFENFLFPFIIMFSMPATIVGVVGGLLVSGLSFSIPAFIGIIMLAGIVVNNSIVLVDYINILRRRGVGRYEAIIEAGKSRLRPILMTTLTTVLAMIPLGLALGEGAEMQQPLAITIIFGLTVSSIFTLFLIPVVYTFFDDLTRKILRRETMVPIEELED